MNRFNYYYYYYHAGNSTLLPLMFFFQLLIVGFCYLKISDQRQLVRSAMYPIMLLELSRDYVNEDRTRYNYFDFT